MGQKNIAGDLNVVGAIKHNGTEISYDGGNGYQTVTITLAQVVSQNPLQIQLTNEQFTVFASSKLVLIDLSALGETSVLWNYTGEDSSDLNFGFAGADECPHYYKITINKSTKIATYRTGNQSVPYTTSAPISANTDGGLIIVATSNEPQTKYNGYIYIIHEQ